MAVCASCGRGDLLQADVANYQCLACGALTSIATNQVVPNNLPNPVTSPSGHPAPELSANVVEAEANEYAPPDRNADESPEAPEEPVEEPVVEEEVVEPEPEDDPVEEVVEEAKTGSPIDLSSLSDEQIQALREALD